MPARPCSHAPEHLPVRALYLFPCTVHERRASSVRAHRCRRSLGAAGVCHTAFNMQHAPVKRNIHGSVPQVQISRVTRSVLADEPRVTRFQIKWDEMEQEAMPEPDTLMPSELEVPMVM